MKELFTIYLMFGPPGSGKGFCMQVLHALLSRQGIDIGYIPVGDLTEKIAEESGVLGDAMKQCLAIKAAGGLMPNVAINTLAWRELHREVKLGKNIIFLDGYPRTFRPEDQPEDTMADAQWNTLVNSGFRIERMFFIEKDRAGCLAQLEEGWQNGTRPRRIDDEKILDRLDRYNTSTKPIADLAEAYRPDFLVRIPTHLKNALKVLPIVEGMCLNGEKKAIIDDLMDPDGEIAKEFFIPKKEKGPMVMSQR